MMVVVMDVLDWLGGDGRGVVGRLWRVVGCLRTVVRRLGSLIIVAKRLITSAGGSIICAWSSIASAGCSIIRAWGSVARAWGSIAGAGDSVVVSRREIRRLGCCVVPVDTVSGIIRALVKQFLDSINRIGNALQCEVHIVVGSFVTAQNTAAIGSEVKIDQGLEGKFSVIIGGSLEAEERVEVDRSDLDTLSSSVVRVDSAAASNGVLLVTSVARTGLRKSKGDTNCWLELSG